MLKYFQVIVFFFILFCLMLPVSHAALSPVENVFISPLEVNAGEKIAEVQCASCHGLQGASQNKAVPHLASQHADYLYLQLRLFQSAGRIANDFSHSLDMLNQNALMQVAAYYSVQDLPSFSENQISKKAKSKKARMSPVQAGKLAAEKCANCHGTTGNGTFSGMPRLTGKHQRYLVSAMKAYQRGDRVDAMMKMAMRSVSDLEIENIALFYANQKPVDNTKIKALGDAALGRELASSCGGCHGEVGHSGSNDIPSLAGQDAAYLIKAMNAYKKGLREHQGMRSAVETLTNKKVTDIAAFYAAQSALKPEVVEPEPVEEIAAKCDRCHGINGNSRDRMIPSISAQNEDYLVKAMIDYQQGRRVDTMMQAMLNALRGVDLDALAHHYSKKQRRAVVFVDQACD